MKRGVTLLEMLVAAFVLAVGLVGTLTVIAASARNTREIEDRARATMFARSKLDEILKEPVIQVGSDQGKDSDQTTDYDWTAVIDQSQNQNLLLVTVTAENRITHVKTLLTALRRPDISSPLNADGTAADPSTTDTTGGSTGAGAGGT